MERFHTLDEYLDGCWQLLRLATQERKASFRTPVLATVDGGAPRLRTVVLRRVAVAERLLLFYTDRRSAKVSELRENPQAGCLFYDEGHKLQVRVQGRCRLHAGDELSQQCWRQLPVAGRRSYATLEPPGRPADHSTSGLPAGWDDQASGEATDFAYRNFLVISTEVMALDCLHLHSAGHQRAVFIWQDSRWQGQWRVP